MHSLRFVQFLNISLSECWDFFSSPNNLKLITPVDLGFSMQAADFSPMYAGQIIRHTIRPIGNIPIEWVTEITHVEKPYYFIDEQRFGPYKFWHHEHRFTEKPNGVEMNDIIHYKLHFGILGELLNTLKVKGDLETIFGYRQQKLCELFDAANLS
jgi:ligand-binding SRPBCC domain-containing protein